MIRFTVLTKIECSASLSLVFQIKHRENSLSSGVVVCVVSCSKRSLENSWSLLNRPTCSCVRIFTCGCVKFWCGSQTLVAMVDSLESIQTHTTSFLGSSPRSKVKKAETAPLLLDRLSLAKDPENL